MKFTIIVLLLFVAGIVSWKIFNKNNTPSGKPTSIKSINKSKLQKSISFNLELLDEHGLIGPEDGKRALDYFYLVPNNPSYIKELQSIDPSFQKKNLPLELKKSTCKNCISCIGTTHQKNHLKVLKQLSDLEYVNKIEELIYLY